jgi:hypothetical protein
MTFHFFQLLEGFTMGAHHSHHHRHQHEENAREFLGLFGFADGRVFFFFKKKKKILPTEKHTFGDALGGVSGPMIVIPGFRLSLFSPSFCGFSTFFFFLPPSSCKARFLWARRWRR